jgi:hypothetical protein
MKENEELVFIDIETNYLFVIEMMVGIDLGFWKHSIYHFVERRCAWFGDSERKNIQANFRKVSSH